MKSMLIPARNCRTGRMARGRLLIVAWLSLVLIALAACGAAAPATPAAPLAAAEPAQPDRGGAATPQTGAGAVVPAAAPAEHEAGSPPDGNPLLPANQTSTAGHMIIKNAELELLVEDTDTTINRSLGIITEYGGYVVSTRTWFQNDLKYATLTVGVPVENFEAMLRRLKGLAVAVTNETASGQDVTDQYVDLESRLRNLEATAARIREFLNQAQGVDQALEVNARLTEVEAEIEQVKGQLVYLRDRSAFSTITMQISPQLPPPDPTPAPTPTPTPEPWSAARTFDKATGVTSHIARSLLHLMVDLAIWLAVVGLPFSLPIIGLILAWGWLARRLEPTWADFWKGEHK